MAWARIDDNFFNHPKVRKAGKDAIIFHMAALCYSNAFTTDGFIADVMLELIATQAFQRKANGLADRLVECGLWDSIEGGYLIHDFLDYNYSRQQIDEIKRKRSAAGKQGGRPAKANVKQNESKTKANVKQNESHTHTHINTHTNTDINPTNQSSSIAEKGDDDDLYKAFETIAAVTPQARSHRSGGCQLRARVWPAEAVNMRRNHSHTCKGVHVEANGKPSKAALAERADV